jgi:hypothetical protein
MFIKESTDKPGKFEIQTNEKTDLGEYEITVKVFLADRS